MVLLSLLAFALATAPSAPSGHASTAPTAPSGHASTAPTAPSGHASTAPSAPSDRATAARERSPGTELTVVESQYGRIVGDGPGKAVYVFDKERRGASECYGACARAWPPVFAKGRPVAGAGIPARLIGTTRRRGGRRQLTYRGRPLYYYVDDAPGRVLCHDVREFGGLWLVIRPDGKPVG